MTSEVLLSQKAKKMAEEGFACVKLYPNQANKSQNNALLALSFEKIDLEAGGKLLILLLFARFLSTIFHIENCCNKIQGNRKLIKRGRRSLNPCQNLFFCGEDAQKRFQKSYQSGSQSN